MIQTQIQTAEYWESAFSLTDSDLEQIYNYLLDKEKPQPVEELARVVIESRVRQQASEVRRLLSETTVYQPQKSFKVGEEVVFPALKMARGTVTAVRPGYNPEHSAFNVVSVTIKGKTREFASDFHGTHVLNAVESEALTDELIDNVNLIQMQYGRTVAAKINASLSARADFVQVSGKWFVKSLMADVNIGHLHLAEAVLEVADGGPLTTAEILPQLELDPGVDREVQEFSLVYHLTQDGRFDDVSATPSSTWYLRRMEPEGVQKTPERLVYHSVDYDRSRLTHQQIALEQELDDEWSDLPALPVSQPVILTLSFPHRWAGTIPLNAKTRTLFAPEHRPRQRIVFIDDETQERIPGWVVAEGRYVYGLAGWYRDNSIPVGGYLHLQQGPEPGSFLIGFDRRRPQREWVRLATVRDNKIHFELNRRAVPCGYDDLLIVGTDAVTALDTHARRANAMQMSVAALLGEVFPTLAGLSPQNSVHAKTLYSAVNMLRRTPPGPIFAELVRNPAFVSVGDHYWQQEGAPLRDRE